MKINLSMGIQELASLPGSRPGGGSSEPIEVIGSFLSSAVGGEGLSACDLEKDTRIYKNNGDEALKNGDKVYTDAEGKTPFLPGSLFLSYLKEAEVSGYYGVSAAGVVQFLSLCPLPIAAFASTTEPVGKGEACEVTYEGTFLYKEGTALIAQGNRVYLDIGGTELADPGYYKAVFDGVQYDYEINNSGRARTPVACE